MRSLIFILAALTILSSCKQEKPKEPVSGSHQPQKETTISAADTVAGYQLKNEHMVLATLFHQKSGEYKALCYQAFNLGKLMLDVDLKDQSVDKHRIVVLDIDETVLDNSPFQAECIANGTSYPVSWDEWCMKASAKPLPGVLSFLNYARSNGVSVFYITNRKSHLKDVTIQNLVKMGLPQADAEHVITRSAEDSKEGRRQELLKNYHISLLFGDNLNDFTDIFEKQDPVKRNAAVDQNREEFGRRFIVLPNAMYGDWELALYDFNQKQADSVKFKIRREALTGF
jgi:5'-nucleotidase (lipoprotein e(P4) family)